MPSALSSACTDCHLVSNRTDATDPSGDVGGLFQWPAAQQGLEETGRLVNFQLHIDDIDHLQRRRVNAHFDLRRGSAPPNVDLSSSFVAHNGTPLVGRGIDAITVVAKCGCACVKVSQQRHQMHRRLAAFEIVVRQTLAICLGCRSKAAITATVVGRTDRTATCLRHRSDAGDVSGNGDADRAAAFAVEAHGVDRQFWVGDCSIGPESLPAVDAD